MSDQVKMEMKQAVVNMMHKALMTSGVNALQECVAILQAHEKAGDPLIAISVFAKQECETPCVEEKPKSAKGKKNEAL